MDTIEILGTIIGCATILTVGITFIGLLWID